MAHRNSLLLAALFLAPSLAHAHTGVSGISGLGHPLAGLDHLCAMIAVGLWAAQIGGRALGAVPLTFVTAMAFGGSIVMAGLDLPFVQTGVPLSVLLPGVLGTAAVRLPLASCIVIVALFAIFHTYTHGAEMAAHTSGYAYAAGFTLASAALHFCGSGLGIGMQKLARPQIVRFASAAIVLCACVALRRLTPQPPGRFRRAVH